MILSKKDYNPFPVIRARAIKMGGMGNYNDYFYDFVKRELYLGGVVPETEAEFDEILALLANMEII